MKPVLRSTTAKRDAENASPSQKKEKTVAKSQKNGNNATAKENQQNPTMRKNVRRNVQPLQEINAIVIDEKNGKVQTSSTIASIETKTVSTTSSRSRRVQNVSANDGKENNYNVVTKATVKVRNAKKQSVRVTTSVGQPETVVTLQEQTPDASNQPTKRTTQKTVVPLNIKTRSTSNITESVTKVATKTTNAGDQITSSSSVVVRRTKNKTTSEAVSKSKPTVTETTQFVSTRRNRRGNDKRKASTDDESTTKKPKAATDDESKTKQPVVRNVTTRSRSTVKNVQEVNTVRTSKRSKSQSTAVGGIKSNIPLLPPKQQRSNSASVRKINGRDDKSTKAKATTDDESKSKSSVTSKATKRKRKPTADVESKATEPVKTKTPTDDESKIKKPTVTNTTTTKVEKVFATQSRSATTGSNTKRFDIIISPPKRQKTNNSKNFQILRSNIKELEKLTNRTANATTSRSVNVTKMISTSTTKQLTKVTVKAKSPMKKPPTSTVTQQQTEKPKSLANDLQKAFAYSDDKEENNECDPQRQSLPGINSSTLFRS